MGFKAKIFREDLTSSITDYNSANSNRMVDHVQMFHASLFCKAEWKEVD